MINCLNGNKGLRQNNMCITENDSIKHLFISCEMTIFFWKMLVKSKIAWGDINIYFKYHQSYLRGSGK